MYKVELYVRVRRACMVDGMSTRKAARVFGLHRGHGAQDAQVIGASPVPSTVTATSSQAGLEPRPEPHGHGSGYTILTHPPIHQPQINPTLWIQPA